MARISKEILSTAPEEVPQVFIRVGKKHTRLSIEHKLINKISWYHTTKAALVFE